MAELSTLGSVIKTAYEAEADTNAFTDAEKTKLTNIEASADVTDTANVTAAGALMDSEVTNLAAVKAFDPTDYATAAQGSTADTALQDVVDDLTPTLGGNLAAGGFNITDLGDVTFKTGAAGGTLRTGTSAADKFQLQAYDVDGAAYVTLIEADAGNTVRLQVPVDYLDLEDATDTTKIARLDSSSITTGTTRTYTFPDATGTFALSDNIEGTAIKSSGPVTDGYVLTAVGDGTAAWEAAAAGSGDFKADGTVDMTGEFKTDVGTFGSDVADGASAVAFRFGNTAAYSTSGAKLLVLDNAGTDVLGVSYQGGISHLNSGATTAAHAQSLNLNWDSLTTQTSSGQYSVAIGYRNTASGARTVALGELNTVSAYGSAALGGGSNTVSNQYSASIGGQNNTISERFSAAVGKYAEVTNRVTFAIGADYNGSAGHQAMTAALKAATTDATQTTLKATTIDYVIPADVSWAFSALVVGRSDEADGNDSAAYRLEGLLSRDEANNTALVGSVTKTVIAESAGATAWDVTAEADDTNEALAIKVTGEAATNIRWVAKVDIAQVTYA